MESIKIIDNKDDLKENLIYGEPQLINSVINFNGKNNVLFCQKNVILKDAIINYNGDNSIIYLSSSSHVYPIRLHIFNNSVVFFGKNNKIDPFLRISIQESKNLLLGDNCIIGANVSFRTSDGFLVYDSDSKNRLNNPHDIFVGDNVVIGDGCHVSKGCTIESNAIISHYSNLSNNFFAKSNCYYEGNPARLIHENVIFKNKYTGYFVESDITAYNFLSEEINFNSTKSYNQKFFDYIKGLSSLEKLNCIHDILIPIKEKNDYYIKDIDFDKYKLALKGLDHFYFLINDSNQELKQHFDKTYSNNFDATSFIKNLKFKESLFSNHGIKYYYFVVPDKSIVCKELLPFNIDFVKRNIDLIPDFDDFASVLKPNHYFNLDSHINYDGGLVLTFNFLNMIDPSFTVEIYRDLLKNAKFKNIIHNFDFLTEKNWSYSNDEKLLYSPNQMFKIPIPQNLIDAFDDIPSQFNFDGVRKSEFFKNNDSYSDLRVLIFRDSSTNLLKWFFPFYFKESFFYWDHGNLNEDVIRWFNPDVVIELRTERLLDNVPTPEWVSQEQNIL